MKVDVVEVKATELKPGKKYILACKDGAMRPDQMERLLAALHKRGIENPIGVFLSDGELQVVEQGSK